MGLWGISNILLCTGLFIIFYFSYSSSLQDEKPDNKEFFKLSGILILLALICVVFFEISFFAIRASSWLVIYVLSIIKNEIFTSNVAYTLTLILVNVGGAYMIWELHKEKKEEEKFKNETQNNFDSLEEKTPLTSERKAEKEVTEEKEDMTDYQNEIKDEILWQQDEQLPDKIKISGNADNSSEIDSGDDNESTHEYHLFSKIHISHRVAKILHEAGINTVEQLTQHTTDELKEKKNIGEKSLHEIVKALEKAGYALKS